MLNTVNGTYCVKIYYKLAENKYINTQKLGITLIKAMKSDCSRRKRNAFFSTAHSMRKKEQTTNYIW